MSEVLNAMESIYEKRDLIVDSITVRSDITEKRIEVKKGSANTELSLENAMPEGKGEITNVVQRSVRCSAELLF